MWYNWYRERRRTIWRKKLFEVISQKSNSNYYSVLIDLDSELKNIKSNKSKGVSQYTKLYKGVDRYE